MIVWQIFSWWYSDGFSWVISKIKRRLNNIGSTLAIDVLLKTLFAPWKQITSNNYRINFFQKLIDNSISRLIGFFVRFFMLLVGGIWALVSIIIGICWLIIWPIIPLLIVVFPILFSLRVGV